MNALAAVRGRECRLWLEPRPQKTRLYYNALGRVLTRTSRFGLANAETTTSTSDQPRSGFYNVGSLTTASNAVASLTYDQDKGGRQVKR